jgi:tetratricopeptide (TPR) repeat protein
MPGRGKYPPVPMTTVSSLRRPVLRVVLWAGLASGGLLVPAASGAQDADLEYPACDKTPTAADVEGAKGAHKAASQFFERGDYQRAIQYWKDAYGFDCTKPALLLNIANAYEKKGDKEAAIKTLETYLERAPEADDADTVRAKVDNLKASLVVAPPTASTTAEPTPSETAPPPPPPPPTEGERPYGIAPWFVAGSGLALSVGGFVMVLVGQGKIDDAEAECPSHSGCSQDAADTGSSGNTLRLVGSIMLPVGLAALGGGIVWQFVFNEPEARSAAGVFFTPEVGPNGAGMSAVGRF